MSEGDNIYRFPGRSVSEEKGIVEPTESLPVAEVVTLYEAPLERGSRGSVIETSRLAAITSIAGSANVNPTAVAMHAAEIEKLSYDGLVDTINELDLSQITPSRAAYFVAVYRRLTEQDTEYE